MQRPTISSHTRPVPQIPPRALRVAAIAMTVVLLALSVPVVGAAVSAGMGLVAIAALAAGGVLAFQALPWAMQRLENTLLRMRKAEAGANPIEQLENDVLRRSERLTAFCAALATVGGQVASIRQMLDERQHQDPGHVLADQQRALQRLSDFYTLNLTRLDQAQAAVAQFKAAVSRKKSQWEIAQAIHAAAQLLDPNAAPTLIQDLLTDEALRSVQSRFNTVFAELDIQMRSVQGAAMGMVEATGQPRPGDFALPAMGHSRTAP